jgi:hypothetical protein
MFIITSSLYKPLAISKPQCVFDVRGSVHDSTILTVTDPTRRDSVSKFLLSLILNEAQHVLGDMPPIIRSLILRKRSLVLHNTVEGCRTCSC